MKNLITRRAFLIDAVSFGGSVIMKEEIVQSVIDYFTAEGKPLLIPPTEITNTLYATQMDCGEYQLNFASEPDEYPSITWREYLDSYTHYGSDAKGRAEYFAETDIEISDSELDQECWQEDWLEQWCRHSSPNAEAYDYLANLGESLTFSDDDYDVIGSLNFIDGECPGNDYKGVHAADELSVSLLQEWLKSRGESIRVVIG